MKDAKNKIEALQWLDGSSWWYSWEILVLWEKYEALEPRIYSLRTNSGRMNQSFGWSKNKNYVIRILYQFKLMTSNGFGILLILVERIKIDKAQTWEGLQRTTGRIWKQQKNWYENEGRRILNSHLKYWKWKWQRHKSPEIIGKRMMILEGI